MRATFSPAIAFALARPFALITLVGKLGQEKRCPAVLLGIVVVAIASGTIGTGLLAGLYLEIFFGVAVVCLVAGIVMRSLGGHKAESRR